MICLPPLLVDGWHYLLPAADRSAAILGELLLEPTAAAACDRLTAALRDDPPLALWTYWRRRQRLGAGALKADEPEADRPDKAPNGPLTAGSLAEWLIGDLDGAMVWPEEFEPPAILSDSDRDPATLLTTGPDDDRPPDSLLADLDVDLPGWAAAVQSAIAAWSDADKSDGLSRLLPLLARHARHWRAIREQFESTLEREKIESLAELAAGAGHEINNPLTVISGRAQLLLREEADAERRRDLALISAQAMRVNEMIADMRLFARPPQPKPRSFDAAALLTRLCGELNELYRRQEIPFQYDGPAEGINLLADPTQVEVALRAICRNAAEAIARQGSVRLELQRFAAETHISVGDDGPGVTVDERRHIFDPFYSARQAGRGLGLGLSKAWRIAQAHGGRIDVDSAPGRGSVFTLVLPAGGEEAES